MNSLIARSQQRLSALSDAHRLRRRHSIARHDGIWAQTSEGRRLRVFCSNDYLGLSQDARVQAAAAEALQRFGVGSTASQHVCGYSSAQAALEEAVAAALGAERALVGGSGYALNTGALPVLAGRGDQIFSDALNHASLIDGCRLSHATVQPYPHRDMDTLARLLEPPATGLRWLVSDAIFSMDGDCAPFARLDALAHDHDAYVYLDDAHGFGWAGQGRGHWQAAGLGHERVVQMVTFGKSLGAQGAALAGQRDVIEMLLQDSRTTMFATALPPALCAAAHAALLICLEDAGPREALLSNIARFRQLAAQAQLPIKAADGPIQALELGTDERALAWSEALREQGFWVNAIRPPTVPAGTARLRITLSAAHDAAAIDGLVNCLAELQTRELVAG